MRELCVCVCLYVRVCSGEWLHCLRMARNVPVSACTSVREYLQTALAVTPTTRYAAHHPDGADVSVSVNGNNLRHLPLWMQLKGHLESLYHGHDVTMSLGGERSPLGIDVTTVVYHLRPGSVFGFKIRSPRVRAAVATTLWTVTAAQVYRFVDPVYVPSFLPLFVASCLRTANSWTPW